jgi:hypothetical protein
VVERVWRASKTRVVENDEGMGDRVYEMNR